MAAPRSASKYPQCTTGLAVTDVPAATASRRPSVRLCCCLLLRVIPSHRISTCLSACLCRSTRCPRACWCNHHQKDAAHHQPLPHHRSTKLLVTSQFGPQSANTLLPPSPCRCCWCPLCQMTSSRSTMSMMTSHKAGHIRTHCGRPQQRISKSKRRHRLPTIRKRS